MSRMGKLRRAGIILAALAVFGLGSGPAVAGDWTENDTLRQLAYSGLHVADWRQTLRIAANPDRFSELNTILGEHPSDSEVNRYFIATGIAQFAIAYALPPKWRRGWQYLGIGIQTVVVAHNYSEMKKRRKTVSVSLSANF